MPRGRIAFSGQSLLTEELATTQSTLSTYSPNQRSEGDVLPSITYPGSKRRRRPWLAAVGALLAAAAVVFLVSYCHLRITDAVGSKLPRRRLAGGRGEDDRQASGSGASLFCDESGEELGQKQEVLEPDTVGIPAPSDATDGGAVAKVKRGRKRKDPEERGEGYSPKLARFSEESGVSKMKPSVSQRAMEPPSGSALPRATAKKHSDPSTEFAKPHPVVSSGEESGGLPCDTADQEGDALKLPESMLEFYISEALKGAGEPLLEPWLLDPESSMPPSPSSDVSSDEDLESEGSSGSNFQKPLEASDAVQVRQQQQGAAGSDDGSRSTPHDPETSSVSLTKRRQPSLSFGGPSSAVLVQRSRRASKLIEEASAPDTGGEGHHVKQAGPSTSADLGERGGKVLAPVPSWEPPYNQHPFYRVPDIPDDTSDKALKPQRHAVLKSEGSGRRLVMLLNGLQKLLVKPSLAPAELQTLVDQGQALLDYAEAYLTKPLSGPKTSDFSRFLFTRFFVADQLFRVCAVAGQSLKNAVWWEYLMRRMLAPPHSWTPDYEVKQRRNSDEVDLVLRVLGTLDRYRAGERPDAATVVGAKQAILGLFSFSSSSWNSWRQADVEFWSSVLQ